jgi:hypothetical protein
VACGAHALPGLEKADETSSSLPSDTFIPRFRIRAYWCLFVVNLIGYLGWIGLGASSNSLCTNCAALSASLPSMTTAILISEVEIN